MGSHRLVLAEVRTQEGSLPFGFEGGSTVNIITKLLVIAASVPVPALGTAECGSAGDSSQSLAETSGQSGSCTVADAASGGLAAITATGNDQPCEDAESGTGNAARNLPRAHGISGLLPRTGPITKGEMM
jgi:hypothetical protein